MSRIAIVGMACQYPDATSPSQLWENALAGRRAFRRLPGQRMRLEDYWDPDPSVPDRFHARVAAVLEGYEFDRLGYKVAGSTYRSTDMTHWLALDVAARALGDAGFPMGEGLPHERTAVIVGNSLTGEFSRANVLRLRWPYVRRTVAAGLAARGWSDEQLSDFLSELETMYKRPFPEIDEDSLAGGLSNTIAGRICNYFDLKGGGYTVDGACSSSLLSVATACKGLTDGDVDVAIAGGVDLSIDPFEIIGFAKAGALAAGEMRVYDQRSNGFWPGEGCGMVVLMREDDARRAGHRVYASVAGWGISSDGKGGITRPEVGGYQLALRRAYERAGFDIDTVCLFEGHGTGTKVGDETELTALAQARSMAGKSVRPAAIGSIKAMIGHTKAAAGVAGLIKTAMAVHHQVLPPTVGCFEPHNVFAQESATLRMLRKAESWPADAPVRAGITAMGFGGINTHVVLESANSARRGPLDRRMELVASSIQDAELLLVDGHSPADLQSRISELAGFVPRLSYAQLTDLAVKLYRELRNLPYRAAVVASSPDEAESRLKRVHEALEAGEVRLFSVDGRTLLGHVTGPGRVGYLFPGQGSGRGLGGGALRRRFSEVDQVYASADLPMSGDATATEVAQPRIVTGSLAGLRALSAVGLEATVAVGHSLGEIAALYWAGAMTEQALLRITGVRGRTMAAHGDSGTMASIAAPAETVSQLIAGTSVVIAGYNGPTQTVVAGAAEAVELVCAKAKDAGLGASQLRVSHAFHSPLVAAAAEAFAATLTGESFAPVERRVISTVTGEALAADTDIAALLRQQITDPVLFGQALALAAKDIDLFVEVGPGQVLAGLAAGATEVPAISLNTDDESLAGLLRVAGAAYVVGAAMVDPALFTNRLARHIDSDSATSFLANPCEEAPSIDVSVESKARADLVREPVESPATARGTILDQPREAAPMTTVELIRQIAAQRAELPVEMVSADSRLLDDLHLSSITVGQVVNQAVQRMGLPATQVPTNFASASVRQLADALDGITSTAGGAGQSSPASADVAGAGRWTRAWRIDLDEQPRPARVADAQPGSWRVYADSSDPYAPRLRQALIDGQLGKGVLVCLPEECTEADLEYALSGVRDALGGADRFVLVQHGRGAAGLAKTLHLEDPRLATTVVHVAGGAVPIDAVVADVAATVDFCEIHYDVAGVRRVPVLRPMPVRPARTDPVLTRDDVLLVTGGGKGITAECALAIAKDTGVRLAIVGRSDPARDKETADNLKRMADSGVTLVYQQADVTDADQVRRAVGEVVESLGPITAVLHGAGRNEPSALATIDTNAMRQTIAPKIDGLSAILGAVVPERLRLLVTFGSIIGRAGLRGEGHYATANEWLAHATREIAGDLPNCRCICLEWSVWSGVGMGERLSVVESLTREGIQATSPEDGIAVLRRLIDDPDTPEAVVVSGRTGELPTVHFDKPELPLLRFLERPLVHYPGVELVTEVEINAGTDPYLADHLLDGNLLLPAVFGMEAMAQVATAVTGWKETPTIEGAEFLRPIVVPPAGSVVIRVAAVVVDDDTVDVAIRSDETGFAVDHFLARLRIHERVSFDGSPPEQVNDDIPLSSVDPMGDLYGDILFQGGRFQRVRGYHRAAARHVDVDVAAVESTTWFAGYLPQALLLGDPGVRDALMHGNQVCVPDATLLPVGIERLQPGGARLTGDERLRYCAVERSRDGDTYVYDVALRNTSGEIIERWQGLRLRAVRKRDGRGPWAVALLGPYLERTVEDLIGHRLEVAVEPESQAPNGRRRTGQVTKRRASTARAATRAAGHPVKVRYRPDGRPELDGGRHISSAHGADLTLCVIGQTPLGCDIQSVSQRTAEEWSDLLGRHHELARQVAEATGEDHHTAATRVWSALECMAKSGSSFLSPLSLRQGGAGGWVVFGSGETSVAVLATTVKGLSEPVVFAVLAERS